MIHFFSIDVSVPLFPRLKTKRFLKHLFQEERGKTKELTYIFCTDDYLLNINRNFLQHDYYTDIITFDLSEQKDGSHGEIYISIDRVKDNAVHLKEPLQRELLRVIFHGALHLCGYKDKTKVQERTMRKKEDYYLEGFYRSTWNK